MRVKEYHDILIRKHPYAESLNKKLLVDAEKLLEEHALKGRFTNVMGQRTYQIYHLSENIQKLVSWILDEYRYDRTVHTLSPDDDHLKKRLGCWIARYNKGDSARPHHHKPHTWGFVYFINTPKGSSPLVFTTSGKKVKAEAGKVVIFPAQVMHSVPINKCDNRIVCAGNITSWSEDNSLHMYAPINI